MELRLKGFGTVEIIDATRVAGDDILVKSADNFRTIEVETGCVIKEAYLVEVDFKWSFVAWFNDTDDCFTEDSVVFQIESQEDIYRLNARL